MISNRLSILLGVATATLGVALLGPVSGTMAGGGGGGSTHGSFPTGPNQNSNAGNSSSGSGGSGTSGGHLLPPGVHVPPGSGSGSGHGGPNGGPGHPPR
jgi:hypothetical protein